MFGVWSVEYVLLMNKGGEQKMGLRWIHEQGLNLKYNLYSA